MSVMPIAPTYTKQREGETDREAGETWGNCKNENIGIKGRDGQDSESTHIQVPPGEPPGLARLL